MKIKHLLKTFCLSVALIFSVSAMWAADATKTEGFETATAGTTYNSTVTVSAENSDCGISWEIYYGTVSTSSKITGNNSAALRLYTTANYGYIKTTTALEGLSKVTFNAKAATSNSAEIKVNILYSTNGTSWTTIKSDEVYTSSSSSYSYDIPSGGQYLQIAISENSTKPTTKNAQLTIDDIVFTYTPSITDTEAPTFSTGYPTTTNIKATSVDLLAKINEAGKVYYKVVADGADAPSVDDIIADDSYITCTANTEASATISNLTKATAYDIYVVAKDNSDNKQATATKLDVTTENREISSVSVAEKLYTGEKANISWTTDNVAEDVNMKIEIYNGTEWSTLASSTANDGSEDVTIDANATYGTNYKVRVSLADDANLYAESNAITIVPDITINKLVTDTAANGESNYKGKVVRVKGLVTGIKIYSPTSCNFTLQGGDVLFNSIYVSYCENGSISIGDSVYVEGLANYSEVFLQIGKSASHSQGIIINSGNDIPQPTIVSFSNIKNKAYFNKIVKLENIIITSKQGNAYIGKVDPNSNDSISIYNNLFTSNMNLETNRKYDITAAAGYRGGAKTKYELWPRTKDNTPVTYTGGEREYQIDDIYLYSNDTTLSVLTINGSNAIKQTDDNLFATVDAIYMLATSARKGIVATANDEKATVSVKVNNVAVDAASLAEKTLNVDDIVTVTVVAEDGTEVSYNIPLENDNRTFTFTELSNSSFSTGNTINLTWTQANVGDIDIYFEADGNSRKLNTDVIAASALSFSYVVPNSVNGDGYIKAVTTTDNYAIASIAVKISDTQIPVATLTPEDGTTNVKIAGNLFLKFDEPVKVATDAKIKVGNLDFELAQAADSVVKAYYEGLEYSKIYSVTLPSGAITDIAGNNPVLGSWSFNTKAEPVPELFFSEYCEGTSNNKYYEIFNPTDDDVDLSNYLIMIGSNGNEWNKKYLVAPKGILASEDVYVVAQTSASDDIKAKADTVTGNTTGFNGDDALGLFKKVGNDTILIDVFGKYRTRENWIIAGVEKAAIDHTLIRKSEFVCGSDDWDEIAGTDSLDSQWIVLECDNTTNLGVHGIGHRAKVLAFNLSEAENAAVINHDSKTIEIEVVYGTDVASLAPQITLSRGATATLGGAALPNTIDFTNPVQIVVTSEDSATVSTYTITVTSATLPSTLADIRTFSFAELDAEINIDSDSASVDALLAYGTDITALTPVFTISAAASVSSTAMVYIDSINTYTYSEPIDFTNPLKIKITAQDTTVVQEWTINVSTIQPASLSIYEIQYTDNENDASPYVDEFVSTIGVITSISGTDIYIQDTAKAWCGLMVYDENGVAGNAKQGDKVKVVGTITEYNTITELKIADIEILSSGNVIEPIVMTIEDSKDEAYEAVLVTFKKVTCKGLESNNYKIEDETDELTVYNKYKLDFEMETDSVYNVTGIMHYYSAGKVYEVIPRSIDDIVAVHINNGTTPIDTTPIDTSVIVTPIEISVNNIEVEAVAVYAYNRTIVVENAEAQIAVFDISGRMVATLKPASSRIEMQMPKAGLYIVKVGTENRKVVLK